MSGVGAVLLPGLAAEVRPTSLGAEGEGSTAFSNVLKTLADKGRPGAGTAPLPAVLSGGGNPSSFRAAKSAAGADDAADSGGEAVPTGAVKDPTPGATAAVDPNSLTLAALVQAAVSSVPPAPPAAPSVSLELGRSSGAAQRQAAGAPLAADAPPSGLGGALSVVAAADASGVATASSVENPASPMPGARPLAATSRLSPTPKAGSSQPATGQSAAAPALAPASASSTPPVSASASGGDAPSKPIKPAAPAAIGAAASPTAGVDGGTAAQVGAALSALAQGFSSGAAGEPSGASPGPSTANTSATPAANALPASGAAASGTREMVIQLDPEHLGSVAIRMRMAGGKLQVDIQVANAHTLDLLNQDRHILSAAVEAAGGSPEKLQLGAPSEPTPEAGRGLAGSGAEGEQARQQASSASADGGGRGRGPGQDAFPSDMARDDDNALLPTLVAPGADGSLYV